MKYRTSMLRLPFSVSAATTTEIYPLSLHDALPISGALRRAARARHRLRDLARRPALARALQPRPARRQPPRSEEHTSELQSLAYLVCRLLLEKKKYVVCYTPTSITHGSFHTRAYRF